MSVTILRAADRFIERERGRMTSHAFSFGPFYDPDRVGFGPIVLCDEHLLANGEGFDTHHHSGVTVVTVPISGRVEHRDSLGNQCDVTTDDVGVFETGAGVAHSEYATAPATRFVQLWFASDGEEPSYRVDGSDSVPVGGGDLRVVVLGAGEAYAVPRSRRAYVHVGSGALLRNSLAEPLSQGDAYLIEGEESLTLTAAAPTRLVVWTSAPD